MPVRSGLSVRRLGRPTKSRLDSASQSRADPALDGRPNPSSARLIPARILGDPLLRIAGFFLVRPLLRSLSWSISIEIAPSTRPTPALPDRPDRDAQRLLAEELAAAACAAAHDRGRLGRLRDEVQRRARRRLQRPGPTLGPPRDAPPLAVVGVAKGRCSVVCRGVLEKGARSFARLPFGFGITCRSHGQTDGTPLKLLGRNRPTSGYSLRISVGLGRVQSELGQTLIGICHCVAKFGPSGVVGFVRRSCIALAW